MSARTALLAIFLLAFIALAAPPARGDTSPPATPEQQLLQALAGLSHPPAAAAAEGGKTLAADELARLAHRVRRRNIAASGLPPSSGLVLVMIDTLRADRLGVYGHALCTSPFLDRLADDGLMLERCFSPSPWTRPSMATVLTGTYSGRHRVFREKWDKLPPETIQLSEILGACGFTTLAVNANPILGSWFGFDEGFDRYIDSDFLWKWMKGKVAPGKGAPKAPWNAGEVNAHAEALVSSLPEGPFFLQLVYLDVHPPRLPPAEYRATFTGPRYLSLYDASILYLDRFLQRLRAALRKAGRGDAWIVVFADHGEGLNTDNHLASNRGHGFDLYDSLIRVPVIVHHPGLAPGLRGRRVAGHASTVDLAPTLLELLGLPHRLPAFQGRSLVPRLLGGPAPAPGPFYAETQWRGVSRCALRLGDWKMVLHEQLKNGYSFPDIEPGDVELYRLDQGDGEGDPTRNLASANREQVLRMRELLDAWRQENRPGGKAKKQAAPDEQTRERLKALGYLQ